MCQEPAVVHGDHGGQAGRRCDVVGAVHDVGTVQPTIGARVIDPRPHVGGDHTGYREPSMATDRHRAEADQVGGHADVRSPAECIQHAVDGSRDSGAVPVQRGRCRQRHEWGWWSCDSCGLCPAAPRYRSTMATANPTGSVLVLVDSPRPTIEQICKATRVHHRNYWPGRSTFGPVPAHQGIRRVRHGEGPEQPAHRGGARGDGRSSR